MTPPFALRCSAWRSESPRSTAGGSIPTSSHSSSSAREEGIGLAALLERISRDWLREKAAACSVDEREQARIKAAAMRAIGAIQGDDPERSERVRERVRARLEQKRAP